MKNLSNPRFPKSLLGFHPLPKTRALLLLFPFLLFCACEKNDDGPQFSLPPTTQTGENTFGCLIDGQLLVPRDGSGSFNVHDIGMSTLDGVGYYEIEVHDFASEKTASLIIHIKGDSISKEYYIVDESNCYEGLDSTDNTNIFCRVWDYEDNRYEYYCSIENSGKIHITKNENGILSGTFSCVAVNDNETTDTIQITQGRFDIDRSTVNLTNYPNQ